MNTHKIKNKIVAALTIVAVLSPIFVIAQADPSTDPNSTGFKVISCDGPDLSKLADKTILAAAQKKIDAQATALGIPIHKYTPCDFNGARNQIQHLMTIFIILGVLAALLLFCYAGYLYVSASFTGAKDSVSKAKSIFRKSATGFAIMLVAWAAVYQLLTWISSNSSASTALLK